jgi:hypothetical protein
VPIALHQHLAGRNRGAQASASGGVDGASCDCRPRDTVPAGRNRRSIPSVGRHGPGARTLACCRETRAS